MGKAKPWDAARDQQLFLLIIDTVKADYNVVAKKWAERYPDDDSKPTASAISQHIYKLQKANGSASPSKAKPAGVFKPSTPSTKRVTNPKTPSSSSKRQKTRNMSDDDDDDELGDFSNLAMRETTARRSKPARGAYVEPNIEDEDVDDFLRSARSESRTVNPTLTNTLGYVSPISKRTSVYDEDDDEVTITASRSVSKKPISNFDYFRQTREDSDASDYQPLV